MLDILIYTCGALAVIGGAYLSYLGVFGHLSDQRVPALIALYGTLLFVLTGGFLYSLQKLLSEQGATKTDVKKEPDILATQDRAWITVDIHLNGPITFDAGGAHFPFLVTILNIGKSPAFKVDILPKVINGLSYPFTLQEQRKVCGLNPDGTNMPGSNRIWWGDTLFPGIPKTQQYILELSPAEIEESKDSGGYLKGRFMPRILGCVDYAIDSSGERHQTFFSYKIMAVAGPKGNPYLKPGRNLPLNKIVLYKEDGDAN